MARKSRYTKQVKATHGNILGDVVNTGGFNQPMPTNKGGGGGWGLGDKNAQPAGGTFPTVNPVMQPKAAGLTLTSQTFPSNYYIEWNLSTWRHVCEQVVRMGYCMGYATMVSWVYECSPFVQSLFNALSVPLDATQFFMQTGKKEIMDDWTDEMCNKPWHEQLRQEILFSKFWGFSGLNFNPWKGEVYKYPMQDLDPINRGLKENTYSFYSMTLFDDVDNTMFIQPSTNNEKFLGWMQAIARSFIMMNLNDQSWIQAGRRLAFPLVTAGYPQGDGALFNNNEINPYKIQAEGVLANLDPSKGILYPYTIDGKGNIVKSIDVAFEKTGTGAKAHDIFVDFNEAKKNEIREMILGGTLTGDAGDKGARSLGEVQERKFDTMNASNLKFVLRILNQKYLPKIRKFYKNLPDDATFGMNATKPMTLADMQAFSGVVTQNGKRLTTAFFEAQGYNKEYIEDQPVDVQDSPPSKPGQNKNVKPLKKDYSVAGDEPGLWTRLFSKKKSFSSVENTND